MFFGVHKRKLRLRVLQRPPLVDHTELTRFHSDDYINFIRGISPDNMQDHLRELQRCEFVRVRTLRSVATLATYRPV